MGSGLGVGVGHALLLCGGDALRELDEECAQVERRVDHSPHAWMVRRVVRLVTASRADLRARVGARVRAGVRVRVGVRVGVRVRVAVGA